MFVCPSGSLYYCSSAQWTHTRVWIHRIVVLFCVMRWIGLYCCLIGFAQDESQTTINDNGVSETYLRYSVYVLFPALVWNRCFHWVHGNYQVRPDCQPTHAVVYVSMKYESLGWTRTHREHWRIKPARISCIAPGVSVSVNHVIYTCHIPANTKHN